MIKARLRHSLRHSLTYRLTGINNRNIFMCNTLSYPSGDESHWLSVSDLMAGLMVVFLFIAIALMRNAMIERNQIKEVAVAYQENQVAIFDALNNAFSKDLNRWDASIDKDSLTFNFNSPDILFSEGEINLNVQYKRLLENFFPRYIAALDPFKDSINEVRIEGHTSSTWNQYTHETDAYFKNMALSQGRTRSVLEYIYRLDSVMKQQAWIKRHVAAVGFSSAKLIRYKNGEEDRSRSRRVSFRIITNADIKIKQILEAN
jgi:outer membrane protein OmpA-like peptidoglycan-associated protein